MQAKRCKVGTIKLRWERCPSGYIVRDRPDFLRDDGEFRDGNDWEQGAFIYPVDGSRQEYEATLGQANIFADLLLMSDNDESVLAFCGKWGTLTRKPTSRNSLFNARDAIRYLYSKEIEGLSDLPSDARRATPAFIQSKPKQQMEESKVRALKLGIFSKILAAVNDGFVVARLELRSTAKKTFEVVWNIDDIRHLLYLEILEDLGGLSSQISTCAACGVFLMKSNVKGRAPEYCSNPCRQGAYRQRKKERTQK